MTVTSSLWIFHVYFCERISTSLADYAPRIDCGPTLSQRVLLRNSLWLSKFFFEGASVRRAPRSAAPFFAARVREFGGYMVSSLAPSSPERQQVALASGKRRSSILYRLLLMVADYFLRAFPTAPPDGALGAFANLLSSTPPRS